MENQNEVVDQAPSTDQGPSTRAAGIRYGLILGVVSIAIWLVVTTMGLNIQTGIGYWLNFLFSIAITCLGMYLAHEYFKNNGNHYMSFGQGFGIGFWVAFISTLVAIAFVYFYIKFVDASYIETLLQSQREAMEAKGMSDEDVDRNMGFIKPWMTAEVIGVVGTIFSMIQGLVIALIMAAIGQKKDPDALPS